MDDEKCIACGSLGGFHMETCPKNPRNEIVVFAHNGELSLGTLQEVLPEDWSARFVRKEGGHFNYCFGMTYKEFAKKYLKHEIIGMIDNPTLPKEYFVLFMKRFLMINIHNDQ